MDNILFPEAADAERPCADKTGCMLKQTILIRCLVTLKQSWRW